MESKGGEKKKDLLLHLVQPIYILEEAKDEG